MTCLNSSVPTGRSRPSSYPAEVVNPDAAPDLAVKDFGREVRFSLIIDARFTLAAVDVH
ncbi:MAG TPA: hypothetical protein VLD57_02280 [Blastocatellia bacterium]|nr:hypothetical protein [Blastocatellia bacterium]